MIQLLAQWQQRPQLHTNSLLLKREPSDELSVYMLFGELVGRGFLPGWDVLYVSGSAAYDAAMQFSIDLSDPNSINSTANGTCALGPGIQLVQSAGAVPFVWAHPTHGTRHLVTECKVTAQELLVDVQANKTTKVFSEIAVLICVDFDTTAISNLSAAIHPVPDSLRTFSGVTHKLLYGNHEIQVICLKEVINQLVAAGKL